MLVVKDFCIERRNALLSLTDYCRSYSSLIKNDLEYINSRNKDTDYLISIASKYLTLFNKVYDSEKIKKYYDEGNRSVFLLFDDLDNIVDSLSNVIQFSERDCANILVKRQKLDRLDKMRSFFN